jgi:hypothetical protein
MDRPVDEYMKVLKLARNMQVRVIKYHGLEVEFLPKLPLSLELEGDKLGSENMPTEDQLLYWSTGNEPDIVATLPEE